MHRWLPSLDEAGVVVESRELKVVGASLKLEASAQKMTSGVPVFPGISLFNFTGPRHTLDTNSTPPRICPEQDIDICCDKVLRETPAEKIIDYGR